MRHQAPHGQEGPVTEKSWDDGFREVRRSAVAAAIAVHNAEVIENAVLGTQKKGVRRHALQLRDALVYRLDATLYHIETLQRVQSAGENRLRGDIREVRNQRGILESVGRQQRILFDDLVFNAVSFFDYLGRFCWSLLQGVADVKMRWDRVYRWAKHSKAGKNQENRIHGTAVGEAIVAADQRWIDRLTQFRSDIIHYKSERLRGQVSTALSPQKNRTVTYTSDLRCAVPDGFRKVVKNWHEDVGDSILEASNGLVRELVADARGILHLLVEELEGRVPEIPDGVVPAEPVHVRKPNSAPARPSTSSKENA
jgi:hypothetical protein